MIAWAALARERLGDEFVQALAALAERLGWEPSWLFTHVYSESSFDPESTSGAGAVGLFQWMPKTIADLRARGIWPGDVSKARILAGGWPYQLELAESYLWPWRSRVRDVGDLRLVGFWPAALAPRAPDSAILFAEDGRTDFPGVWGTKDLAKIREKSAAYYQANRASDRTGKGYLTVGDVRERGRVKLGQGLNRAASPASSSPPAAPKKPCPLCGLVVLLAVGAVSALVARGGLA